MSRTKPVADDMNVNFRAKRKDVQRFYSACKKQGHVPSQILRQMMCEFAAGTITFALKEQTL